MESALKHHPFCVFCPLAIFIQEVRRKDVTKTRNGEWGMGNRE